MKGNDDYFRVLETKCIFRDFGNVNKLLSTK